MTTQEYVKSLIPASIKENNKHYQAVFDAIVMALESCKDVNKYTLIKAGFVYVDCYRDGGTSIYQRGDVRIDVGNTNSFYPNKKVRAYQIKKGCVSEKIEYECDTIEDIEALIKRVVS